MADEHCTECDGNGYHTDDCPNRAVKTCGCGRSYTLTAWAELVAIGFISSEDEAGKYECELRNCACGSTIGIERKVA